MDGIPYQPQSDDVEYDHGTPFPSTGQSSNENLETFKRSANNIGQLNEETLLQATVFLEDALEYRSIHHKVDVKHLKLYRIYYSSHVQWCLSVSVFLIHVLAFIERPSSLTISSDPRYRGDVLLIPCGITETIEILCLCLFSADIYVKISLMGRRKFLKSKWVMVYTVVVLVSVIDWMVTLSFICAEPVRFRRILRPFFLLQNSSIMKKTVNCIKRSLPQIGGVLLVLAFHLYFFTMFGMLLFPIISHSSNPANKSEVLQDILSGDDVPDSGVIDASGEAIEAREHFKTLESSFISLLVLLTTANHPDVMMPAYAVNRFYALFFITFLAIGLYCLFNMLTAIIYNQFRGYFVNSMESSLFRQRLALRAVFEILRKNGNNRLLLVSDHHSDDVVSILDLSTIISNSSIKNRVKNMLNIDLQRVACDGHYFYLEDFLDFFDIIHRPQVRRARPTIRVAMGRLSLRLQQLILHRYFLFIGHTLVIVNVIVLSVVLYLEYSDTLQSSHSVLHEFNLGFVIYYTLELLLMVWANGFHRYYHQLSNIFDTLITLALIIVEILSLSLFGLPVPGFDHPSFVSTIEVFDLVRITNMFILLKMFRIIPYLKTMSIIFDALVDLIRNLRAFAGIIIVVYYSFAILGMELFNGVIKYPEHIDNITSVNVTAYKCGSYEELQYWANNFDDFASSLVVLWELMVVNNWHVFLDAYKRATHTAWSHLYFIAWYIVSVIIVLNLFTALILENFIMKWDKLFPSEEVSRQRASSQTSRGSVMENSYHRVYSMQEMFREMCSEPTEDQVVHELRQHHYLNFNI